MAYRSIKRCWFPITFRYGLSLGYGKPTTSNSPKALRTYDDKYISDSFEEMFQKLTAGVGDYAGSDPEDKDEYKAENVFFVPLVARWPHLLGQAKQPTISKTVDDAMGFLRPVMPTLLGCNTLYFTCHPMAERAWYLPKAR